MKKVSHQLLQWTLLTGTAALMATACVVTSGDDGDDGFFDGGEGGTSSSSAGKPATGGKPSTAGSSSGGSTSGSGGTAGTGGSTAGGGAGGSASSYVPGVCQEGDMPTSVPSCAPAASDEDQTCKICLKAQCCDAWQTCYGDTPTSACGWGVTEDAPGQFDCIQNCYAMGLSNATDLDDLQRDCADQCLNQCENVEGDMGLVTDITQDILSCANEKCLDECFPAQ